MRQAAGYQKLKMELPGILKTSINIIRKNTILVAPSIIATLITSIFGISITGMQFNEQMYGRFMIVGLVGFIIHAFSVCIIISMTMDVLEGSSPGLGSAFSKSMFNFISIFTATFIISFLAAIGAMFLIIPALVVAYVFMFTYVIIMTNNTGPIDALGASYKIIKARLSDTIVLFLVLIGVAITVQLIEIFLSIFRFFGVVVNVVLSSTFVTFSSITLLLAYRELTTSEDRDNTA